MTRLATPLLVNNLHHILPKSTPLVAVFVPPSSSMAAVSKALPSCHRKVTGATQKLMSTGNHVRYGLASVHSVEKLSAYDFPLKSCSEMAHPELTLANSFLADHGTYKEDPNFII